MKAILVALFLFVAASCSTYPPPAWPSPFEDEVWHDDKGVPIVLEKGPIWVHSDPSTAVLAHHAVDTWNGWLGFELLKFTPVKERANIRVVQMEPNHLYAGITMAKGQRRLIALARMNAMTAVHEFGHALGLAHDPDNIKSIMFPAAQDEKLPSVEAGDLVLLRRWYQPRTP